MPPPEEDIRRTLARYCMLCDDHRFEELARLFTEDARLHVPGETYVGRDAIRSFLQQQTHVGRHLVANSLIESDGWGGTASAWSDFVIIAPNEGAAVMGRYHDRLIREGDKVWRFDLREIVPFGGSPELTESPRG